MTALKEQLDKKTKENDAVSAKVRNSERSTKDAVEASVEREKKLAQENQRLIGDNKRLQD